jgi:hypothetical protein
MENGWRKPAGEEGIIVDELKSIANSIPLKWMRRQNECEKMD